MNERPELGMRGADASGELWVVTTFVVIEGAADRQLLRSEANWTGFWPVRDGEGDDAALLRDAMTDHDFPPGDGFVWIAAVGGVARAARPCSRRPPPPARIGQGRRLLGPQPSRRPRQAGRLGRFTSGRGSDEGMNDMLMALAAKGRFAPPPPSFIPIKA